MRTVIEIAEQEIGYTEMPPNTNKTKYGAWFGFDGVPWCGMFVSWCYASAGKPLGKIGFLNGFAGSMTAVEHFKKEKCIVEAPQEGDIVFFDWNGDGRWDHTGLFVKWLDGEKFETIEGNTGKYNQSNGGEVMRRIRENKNVLFVHVKEK
jgi:hypothetical protein